MRFGNSIRLLMENFKQTYRLFIYKVIMGLVVCALCSALIIPEVMEIIEADVTQELIENFKGIFTALVSHEAGVDSKHYVDAVFGEGGSLKKVIDLILSMRWELVFTVIGCLFVYLFSRFVDTLFYFTIGSTMNDKMATYADTPFGTAFVANLGKASAYAGVYVPIAFLFDAAAIAISCVFLRFLPLLLALFLSVTVIVLSQSFKLTLTNHWMPAMTADGKKLKDALRYENKREKRQGIKVFSLYVVAVYMVIVINVVAAICTFGSALLVTVPTSYLLFICIQYVNYYTMKGKKYFITYERIESNPDHGDSEHFFEYIEEVEKELNPAPLEEEPKEEEK